MDLPARSHFGDFLERPAFRILWAPNTWYQWIFSPASLHDSLCVKRLLRTDDGEDKGAKEVGFVLPIFYPVGGNKDLPGGSFSLNGELCHRTTPCRSAWRVGVECVSPWCLGSSSAAPWFLHLLTRAVGRGGDMGKGGLQRNWHPLITSSLFQM